MEEGFACPHCAAALDVAPAPHSQALACPHCGGSLIIASADGEVTTLNYAAPPGGEDALNAFRIRQLAAARRAAYRSRSYCVIGALVCVVAAVQLAWTGVQLLRGIGFALRPTSYLLFAILAAWAAVYFFRQAVELDREAKQSALPVPTAEPDFSQLRDGSQRWKNLEDIR